MSSSGPENGRRPPADRRSSGRRRENEKKRETKEEKRNLWKRGIPRYLHRPQVDGKKRKMRARGRFPLLIQRIPEATGKVVTSLYPKCEKSVNFPGNSAEQMPGPVRAAASRPNPLSAPKTYKKDPTQPLQSVRQYRKCVKKPRTPVQIPLQR